MADAPSRFWLIRCRGNTVAKFDTLGGTQIPDDVADYPQFAVMGVPDRAGIVSQAVDQSDLTDSERELLSQVYPAR